MQRRIQFTGTGGGLLVRFLGGMILTAITFGLYYPWFLIMLWKYVARNTALNSETGPVKFEFTGSGGKFFLTFLGGYLLTLLTLGIYGSWFMCNMMRFFVDNAKGTAPDGTNFSLEFKGTGGGLFGTIIVGYLLTIVTVGIYGAWFICKLQRFFIANTKILANGAPAGSFSFVGKGGSFLMTFLAGYLLTLLTLGIYYFWFIVKLWKFVAGNTKATINGKTACGSFTGTGGQLFGTLVGGYLLTVITAGIYGSWFICNLLKFELEGLAFDDEF